MAREAIIPSEALSAEEPVWKTPLWFFALGVCLLLPRPFLSLAGSIPLVVPAGFEPYAAVFLACVGLLFPLSRRSVSIFAGWTILFFLLDRTLLVPDSTRWLALLLLCEMFHPEKVPSVFCLGWLTMPLWLPTFLGEPGSPLLQCIMLFTAIFGGWKTMQPNWTLVGRRDYSVHFVSGLLLGFLIQTIYPIPYWPAKQPLPPIHLYNLHDPRSTTPDDGQLPHGYRRFSEYLHTRLGAEVKIHEPQAIATDMTVVASEPGVPPSNPAALSSPATNALIILGPPAEPMSSEEIRRLLQHVAGGGRLLVFLDRGDLLGGSTRLAPLLAELGVTPEIDTVVWPGHREPGTGFSRALGGVSGFPGTGASLLLETSLWPSAFSPRGPHPLVWAQRSTLAHPDLPFRTKEPHLPISPITRSFSGSTCLGAWGSLGSGRWAVLADSSWFHNPRLAVNLPFLHALLTLLCGELQTRYYVFWLGLLASSTILFLATYRTLGKWLFPAAMILGMMFAQWQLNLTYQPLPFPKGIRAGILTIDTQDCQLSSEHPDSWPDNLDSLFEHVFAAGLLPTAEPCRSSLLPERELWIAPPQREPLATPIRHVLREQVQNGSTLLLIIDPTVPAGRQDAQFFGFSLPEDPWLDLASGTYRTPDMPTFRDPIPLRTASAAQADIGSATPMSEAPFAVFGGSSLMLRPDRQSVFAAISVGKGRIIACSDPTLFTNRRLTPSDAPQLEPGANWATPLFDRLARRYRRE